MHRSDEGEREDEIEAEIEIETEIEVEQCHQELEPSIACSL
jgi:hypothetical protein